MSVEFATISVINISAAVDEIVLACYHQLTTSSGSPLEPKPLEDRVVEYVRAYLKNNVYNFSCKEARSYKNPDGGGTINDDSLNVLADALSMDLDEIIPVVDSCGVAASLLTDIFELAGNNRHRIILLSDISKMLLAVNITEDIRITLWEEHKHELKLPF